MSREKNTLRQAAGVLAGMVMGAAMTGGAFASSRIMAEPTWQPIYVDGQQVRMTAYNIAGNNYVKLRDIGQQVGFNVYWDNGVQVDSGSPYTGEPPAAASQTAAVSQADTEAVRQEIVDLTNALRQGQRLQPLKVNALLTQAAQVRAEELAASTTYAHTRPNGEAYYTVTDCPYLAENLHRVADLYLGQQKLELASYVVDSWAGSDTHRTNLLNSQLSDVGVGLARGVNASGQDCWYCVQLFLYDGCAVTWVDAPAIK
nr:CAP domain-containing protein [uncultured Oscillibacter sp.]